MLIKYASSEAILEVKTSATRLDYSPNSGEMLQRFAKVKDEDTSEGYVYVRTRAISSRVNKNNDGWPSSELIKAAKTFIGRPIFVDHNNSDPRRARGVIVDAVVHVEDEKTSALDQYYSSAPANHKPPTWIELLMEVDGKTFPKLAHAIKTGKIDSTSMGANIERSVCSVCGNEAFVPNDYCAHVKAKGNTFEVTADNGERIKKKAYEDCYGVNFFEDSFVFDPADETALNLEVSDIMPVFSVTSKNGGDPDYLHGVHNVSKAASTETEGYDWSHLMSKVAGPTNVDNERKLNTVPQSDMPKSPQKVDTLRDDIECPKCHADVLNTDPDGQQRCPTCGYVQPPEGLDNPDLSKAQEVDKQEILNPNEPGKNGEVVEATDEDAADDQAFIKPLGPEGRDMQQRSTSIAAMFKPYASSIAANFLPKYMEDSKIVASFTPKYSEESDPHHEKFIQEAIKHKGRLTNACGGPPHEHMDKVRELAKGNDGLAAAARLYLNVLRPANEKKEGATNSSVPTGVISEMWKLKVATDNISEANRALLQKTGAAVDTQIEFHGGIHFGTQQAMKQAGLQASVEYPGAPGPLPLGEGSNQMQHFMYQIQAVKAQGLDNPGELTVKVEAPDDELDQVLQIIHSGGEGAGPSVPTASTKFADRRVIKREESPDGHKTEQIIEETGGLSDELETSPKAEEKEDKPEEKSEGEEPSNEGQSNGKPDFLNKDNQDGQKKLLAALAIAEEFVEAGLISKEKKLAFVGQLEEESLDQFEARRQTLALAKAAGLGKAVQPNRRVAGSLPRLTGSALSLNGSSTNLDDVPFQAVFL